MAWTDLRSLLLSSRLSTRSNAQQRVIRLIHHMHHLPIHATISQRQLPVKHLTLDRLRAISHDVECTMALGCSLTDYDVRTSFQTLDNRSGTQVGVGTDDGFIRIASEIGH